MPVWLFVCVLIALTAAPANALEDMYSGDGGRSCDQFAKQYRVAPRDTEDSYFSWAEGFMSGRNYALVDLAVQGNKQLIRDLGSIGPDTQKLLIRQYCNENPSMLYVAAVLKLFNSLKEMEPF